MPMAPQPAEQSLTGLTLPGRFTLDQYIGAGSMGEVYRATSVDSGRPLAVKVIRPEVAADPKFVARFVREGLALERLDSPHVVRVVDLGVARYGGGRLELVSNAGLDTEPRAMADGELLFLAMQWLEGEPLHLRTRRLGGLPGRDVADIALGILDALEAAHAIGLVHRDVKPGNIIVAEKRDILHPWLIDFGIVKSLEGDLGHSLTTGLVAGTPQYFSPEQARGEPVSEDVDLWALGVTLYNCLTQRHPHDAATLARILLLTGQKPGRPLRVEDCVHGASAELVRTVNGLLVFEASKRLRSIQEVRRQLGLCPEFGQQYDDEPPTLELVAQRRSAPAGSPSRPPRMTLDLGEPEPTTFAARPEEMSAESPAKPAGSTLALEPAPRPRPTGPTWSEPALEPGAQTLALEPQQRDDPGDPEETRAMAPARREDQAETVAMEPLRRKADAATAALQPEPRGAERRSTAAIGPAQLALLAGLALLGLAGLMWLVSSGPLSH